MKHNQLADKDLGRRIISKFYLFLIIFQILTTFAFSTKITVFGRIAPEFPAKTINIALIVFLYFLYLAIKNEKIIGVFAALFFHGFFVCNALLMLITKIAIFNVEGQNSAAQLEFKIPITIAMLVINTIIIIYLFHYGYSLKKHIKLSEKCHMFKVLKTSKIYKGKKTQNK